MVEYNRKEGRIYGYPYIIGIVLLFIVGHLSLGIPLEANMVTFLFSILVFIALLRIENIIPDDIIS